MLFAGMLSREVVYTPQMPGGLFVQVDVWQLELVGAVAGLAPGGAVAAAAGAPTLAPERAHQPPDGEPHGRRHNQQCYDGL